MNFRAQLLRSSIARLATTGASLVLSFFLMPFVVATLGEHTYGLWVIVAGIESYYYLLDLGLSVAASRYITAHIATEDTRGVNAAVSTAFVIFSALGIVVAIATLVAAAIAERIVSPADAQTARTLILLTGLSVAAGFPVKAFAGIVYAQLRHDLIESSNVVRKILEVGAIYLALSNGYGVIAYAVIQVVSNQFASVYFWWVARGLWPQLQVRPRYFQKDLAVQMFQYSAWSLISSAGDMIRFKVDALVIGATIAISTVTHFNIGARLAELAFGIIYRATNFMAPLYTRYQSRGEFDEIREKLVAFTRINAWLGYSAATLLVLLGRPFIRRWMGEQYLDAYPILVALAIGQMVEAIGAPTNNVLYGVAKHRFYAISTVFEAAANLALSLILVRRMGMIGVAWGTAVPLVINRLIVIPLYTCKVVGLEPKRYYQSLLPSFAVAGSTLLVGYLLLPGFLERAGYFRIGIAAAALSVMLIGLGLAVVLTKDERRRLLKAANEGYARWRGLPSPHGA